MIVNRKSFPFLFLSILLKYILKIIAFKNNLSCIHALTKFSFSNLVIFTRASFSRYTISSSKRDHFITFFKVYIIFFFHFGCTAWLAGSYFPDQGLNPGPCQWKRQVLTTGPPGNSQYIIYFSFLPSISTSTSKVMLSIMVVVDIPI